MKIDNKVLGKFCHRIPDRSFVVKDFQSFFCQRCTGIYLGFLFGLFFMFVTNSLHINRIEFGVVVLLIPMAFDGITQLFRLRDSNNIFRFTTGLLFGFGIAPILGLSEFGVEFPFMIYISFVFLLTVVLMFASKRFGRKSEVFVKVVSYLSAFSVILMSVATGFFLVRAGMFFLKILALTI